MDIIPVVKVPDAKLAHNLDEIESQIGAIAEKYKGIVLDTEQVPALKKDRAYLNGFRKQLDDALSATRAQILKPYDVIKKRVDGIKALLNEPILEMDNQLKEYEKTLKANRDNHVSELMSKGLEGHSESQREFIMSCGWLIDPRWNLGEFFTSKEAPNKKLQDAVTANIEKATNGLNTILSLAGEYTDACLATFKRTGRLDEALSQLESLKRQAEEARRLQEERRPEPPPTSGFLAKEGDFSPAPTSVTPAFEDSVAPVFEETDAVWPSPMIHNPFDDDEELDQELSDPFADIQIIRIAGDEMDKRRAIQVLNQNGFTVV